MPGMVVLISACRVSGGQQFEISFSHRCPSVVRMSACLNRMNVGECESIFFLNRMNVGECESIFFLNRMNVGE